MQVDLRNEQLHRLAKSALCEGAATTSFDNVLYLKERILLGEASPRYVRLIDQYYRQLGQVLESDGAPRSVRQAIDGSKCIYLGQRADTLEAPGLALATADALTALRRTDKAPTDTIDLLLERLRHVVPSNLESCAKRSEDLLKSCCLSEYPPRDGELPANEYWNLQLLGQSLYGIFAFTIRSDDDERDLVWLRDLLVYVLERLPDRSNPGNAIGVLNRFGLKYPFPDEYLIDVSYGVVDSKSNTFTYCNADNPPPCIVRGGDIRFLESTGSVSLNLHDVPFLNASTALEANDLVAFADPAAYETLELQFTPGLDPSDNRARAQAALSDARRGEVGREVDLLSVLKDLDAGEEPAMPDGMRFLTYRHA